MKRAPSRLVLLAHPATHVISPRFQNAALRAAGLPVTYEALDIPPAALADTVRTLREEGAAGNVTMPHKRAFAALCDRLTDLAVRCGAVNTFWCEDGQLIGDNTDVGGAELTIRALLLERTAGAQVALLGAGGSAAAVICAAERCGAQRVQLYARRMDAAQELAQRFGELVEVHATAAAALAGADLVVNATPVGADQHSLPVDLALVPSGAAVFDLIYHASETAFVRAARQAGHAASDGEMMVIEQGVLAFERWFGQLPDRRAMWQALH